MTDRALPEIGFRLSPNEDPEERLEEALLWKLMKDHYGDRIAVVRDAADPSLDIPTFGRAPSNRDFRSKAINPVSRVLEYWSDPTFLDNAGRLFRVVPFDELNEAVKLVHEGCLTDAFIKSTRMKHHVQRIPRGQSGTQALGDMAYSFIDGPELMVQEWKPMTFEFRFFVIDRKIVTWSPQHPALTPFDFPNIGSRGWRDNDRQPEDCAHLIEGYKDFVGEIAETMQSPHAAVDVAVFAQDGRMGIVEFNPMRLGQLGLFACDVRALVRASEQLVRGASPRLSTDNEQSPGDPSRPSIRGR